MNKWSEVRNELALYFNSLPSLSKYIHIRLMKRKLLIVNHSQFGYHIDYVQYVRFLKSDFDITFLCWDYKLNPVYESGMSVYYVSRKGNKLIRNIRFVKEAANLIKTSSYHCTFIHYFLGCSVITFLVNKKQFIHLDIRTGSVISNSFFRSFYNFILRIESCLFKSISIVSGGLRTYLRIRSNAYILPLGANAIYVPRHSKSKIGLLYVGTFSGRQIEDTVEGLGLFLYKNAEANISYTIIGEGSENELKLIVDKIKKYKLEKYVLVKGYIPHNELHQYYGESNVGVSYVPLTPYFNYQPPTKTFEYLMAGMPVIATGTYEHRQIVHDVNGIIIEDTPESFAEGISLLYEGITQYNEQMIRCSVEGSEWSTIVTSMKNSILNGN